MKSESSVGNYVRYGKRLADSGIRGLRAGGTSYLKQQSLADVLGESARSSLTFAAMGLGAGLLQLCLGNRRSRLARSVAVGAVAATLGFCAGFSWKTRELATCMANGAWKNMGAARDQHWLERHPIDYA